jgi:ABC-2 type transport system ATP-binding protein
VTGVARADRAARIASVVVAMDLGDMLERLARTSSGGMLRRLEIASALLNRPAALFLDEPTVGLDPGARAVVWERPHELRAEAGTTIVVTTHLMEEAERHCHRLAIIDRGRIATTGTPAALRAEHRSDSVEQVFTAVTGRPLEHEGGRLRDVRSQRRIVRRLG